MQAGERVDVIKQVADRLAAEDDWSEIDLILDQFDFKTMEIWNDTKKAYVFECIKEAADSQLSALDQYLMGHARPGDEPWESDEFRIFLTHVSNKKQVAHALKSCLRYYGVDSFVAHDDIQAGKQWQTVIESALHSCDALVGLLHEGFRESDWCDQEVGIALGCGVPVVPIQFDLLPYGFFGSLQAEINASMKEPKDLARTVVEILLRDKRTSDKLAEALVERLIHATSFEQANRLSRMLDLEAPLLSSKQVERLREAEKQNDQLEHAFDFDHHISSIEAKIRATR